MRGLVRFGVNKPVPVNLLMLTILIAGLASGLSMRREFFPESAPDVVNVSLPYPGATPEEIEENLAIKVEDAVWDLDEVDEIIVTLSEGGGGLAIKVREGLDATEATDEIERVVDSLQDLPDDADRITVKVQEVRLPVIRVALYGEMDEDVRKRAIRQVRDDLQSLPGMGEVLVEGTRDYEVRVDVRGRALVKHGISLPEVADAVSAWMAEVPGGTVRGRSGNVKVRTMGVVERKRAIELIEVRSDPDGRAILLRDIASVHEGFVDEQLQTRYDGKPAAFLTVFKIGGQDIVTMAEMVRAYIAARNGEPLDASWFEWVFNRPRAQAWKLGHNAPQPLPVGAKIAALSDLARFVEGRLDLLLRNALYGAVLVFGTLLLFLNWRVAFWVGVGLVTALLGTLLLMSVADVTLNLLTMFGLIVVLGLLVDDAIVVSENIQRRHDEGEPALSAAVDGASQVFWPVVATVMTSIVAFMPLTFIKGRIGDLLGALPWVVACALAMSLIESLLILPSHMGHSLRKRDAAGKPGRLTGLMRAWEKRRDGVINGVLIPGYTRLLHKTLSVRYVTAAFALAVLIASFGMLAGGRLSFVFLANDDSETLLVDVRMPIGTAIEQTNRIVGSVEQAANAQSEVKSISSVVGNRSNIDTGESEGSAPHIAQMFIELKPVEQRDRASDEVTDAIRAAIDGKVDQAERVSFSEVQGGPGGAAVSLRVSGRDIEAIEACAADLKNMLSGYDGLYDISDDNALGQTELRVRLKPGAAALGFTTSQLARQIRGSLYGIDAHVFSQDEEDIDVRVRLDEQTRQSVSQVEDLWVINPQGDVIPLREVAEIEEAVTYATIKRVDRKRSILVTADATQSTNPEEIVGSIVAPKLGPDGSVAGPSPLDEVRQKYPQVTVSFAGRQEQFSDAFSSLPIGFMAAVIMIYVILAWLFASYVQPLVVLLAVPFASVGVIWGHLLLGYDLTFLSLIGFVALSGIVVNDSLILVEFFNHERQGGIPVFEALLSAGKARVRAIFLTTVTTVLGLTPLILEQSFQARFLIPMAIAIAGGLIATTVVVLIVLPSLMLIMDDLKQLAHAGWYGRKVELAETPEMIDGVVEPTV